MKMTEKTRQIEQNSGRGVDRHRIWTFQDQDEKESPINIMLV